MYLYENSIIEDINKLFINNKVKAVVADSLNSGLKRIAAKGEDKIVLPIIVLTGGAWTLDDSNYYSLMHGSEFKRDSENNMTKNINIIPITPEYNMYILARSSRECDMLTREIIFHYSLYPTLTVNIPYGIDNIHTFNILFNRTVTKTEGSAGLVYRTLSFVIQGAYLWHNNTFNLVKELNTDVDSVYEDIV